MIKLTMKAKAFCALIIVLLSLPAYAGPGGGGGGGNGGGGGGGATPTGNTPAGNGGNGNANNTNTNNNGGNNGGNNNNGSNNTGNTPSSSPAAGGTVNLGATILSYQSEEKIGKYIAREISKRTGKSLAQIFITTDLQNAGGALIQYRQITQTLRQLNTQYSNAITDATNLLVYYQPPKSSPATNGAAESTDTNATANAGALFTTPISLADAITAFNTLVGFVSTSTTQNGVTVAPDEMGVIPVIADTLHTTTAIEATYVNLFADTSYVDSPGSLVYQLNQAMAYRAQAQYITNIIGAKVQALPLPGGATPPPVSTGSTPSSTAGTPGAPPATTTPPPSQPDTRFNQLPPGLQNDYLALGGLNGLFDNLAMGLMGTNVLNALLVADFYENNVRGKPANALLYIKLLYVGGENRVKSNPFVNLFTDGPRYSYAGGAVVVYMLVDSNGKTILSGTARDLAGYENISAKYSVWPVIKDIKGNLKSDD